MANEKFSIQESLNYGWATFKSHAGFLIGLMVVVILASLIPSYLVNTIFGTQGAAHLVGGVILRIWSLVLAMITTRISLDLYDTGATTIPNLGKTFSAFLPYMLSKIIYFIFVFVGTLLLVIPGIIVAYMFMYVGFLVIDKNLGPIEALQESKTITNGVKWDLFFFSLILVLLNIGGMLCLGVGILVTAPITLMASVYVYRRLVAAPVAA